jgi:hypothetical protein
MTKTELESKHLAELHSLAADAGISGYRMLRRAELIEKLLEEKPKPRERPAAREREKPAPRERRRPERGRRSERPAAPAEKAAPREGPAAPAPPPTPASEARPPAPAREPARPRRRRRRLWGRGGRKEVRLHDLLLPVAPGRQAFVYAESREACTALLREVAAQLSAADKAPDPIALLIDPSPEELAEWRREAPQAEIIAAGQARHVEDAVAHATRRAEGGEPTILLVDSLSRFAEAYADADRARELLDAARSLTVVAALERRQRR